MNKTYIEIKNYNKKDKNKTITIYMRKYKI